ncbi:sentrin-specific protease 6 isoform X3 [Silurus asotus]|uniref:Sentrin-specific protease 6 isoform X3 n=1 Tax=Silurus asotus TaxID=30991 RepID=A0AAD5AHF9_SILAS|nr:sentrin-specific protease 6 isoform X3 [Silurus asotus]
MPQILEKNPSFTTSTNQRTLQFKGVVLKRRHFQHTLLSCSTKNTKRMGSNNGIENPKPNALPLMDKVGPGEPESSNSVERTSCIDEKPLLGVPRKYRMRDEFSVDYIEITNNVKIEASELASCEWCRSRRLPALLLLMTDAAIWRLREQLVVSTDTGTWDGCRSKHQQETYLLIIFESAPTVLEEAALEEIFAEIGRLKNLSNFTVNLTYEEARDRLTTRERFQANEVKTLSVSDDEDDLMECSSSHAETLVIYPPPPAKGGFSITNEDLHCLNEGNYLNDVIIDFYLKYLEMEWRVRKGSLWSSGKRAMTGWSVQVPQQDNHTDCGVYVLQYVESFITNPPRNFHAAMDLRDWFPQELVKKKRERIKEIIFSLHHQQQAEFGE